MEEGGKRHGGSQKRRTSRQMSSAIAPEVVRLEGQEVHVARVEGTHDVFRAPMFVLLKARWVGDDEVGSCAACNAKFNQLRRKHHCRQCGMVFCAKCCKEKVPFQLESAKGLAQATRDPKLIGKRHVTAGLHVLSTHQQLHNVLAEAGAIKAVCKVLTSVGETEEDTLCDGISALLIFCKSQDLKTKGENWTFVKRHKRYHFQTPLDDGALGPVLSVCTHPSPAPALLALSTLAHIAEHAGTHDAIVDSPKQALPRILAMTASDDEQMQEVALKVLANLSYSSDRVRHKIVQGGLQEVMELSGNLLQAGPSNTEFLSHLVRAMANFAHFRQNAERLIYFVSAVVSKCLRSQIVAVHVHALRFLLSLLAALPSRTAKLLMSVEVSRK
nr:hypothetical protein BaRGS_028916 [Batillaria attramentaria]